MNIINKLYKSLNVLDNERTAISLLLAHSFFVGVFLSYYLAYANGLFLKVFEPKMLPWTYVLSGVVGFIASSVFSFFQKRVAYSWVVMGTLIAILLMVVAFIFGILTVGETNKILVFGMFMALIPVFSLIAIQHGGMTMKLFDLRQGKRLYGVIASGEVISSMIWFFTIPIILQFLPVTWYLLIVSIVGLGIGIFFQWIIVLKFPKEMRVKPSDEIKAESIVTEIEEPKKSKGSIGQLLKNKYFSYIFLLMIFSTLGRVFVDYSFMDVSRQTFGNNLTAFFGIFFGLLKVIELIINTFLAGRLLSRYGVRLGLIILPFLLTVFAIIGIVSYWLGIASMIFLALAMNKLFDKTVRTSLEAPSFKTLYQPLDNQTKLMVQTQTEGNAGQMAVFIAGGLLILFNYIFPNFSMMDSTYFLCFILVIWLFIARNTIKGYRNIVIEKLHDYKESKSTENEFEIGDSIFEKGLNEREEIKLKTFQFLRKYNPSLLLSHLNSIIKGKNAALKKHAFELIESTKLNRFEQEIASLSIDNETKSRIEHLKNDFKNLNNQSGAHVLEAINSNNKEEQLLAINSMQQLKADDISYLSEKLINAKDNDINFAINNFINTQQDIGLHQHLIASLNSSFSGRLAFYELCNTKLNLTDYLADTFTKLENESNKNQLTLIKIVKVLKEMNNPQANDVLLSKLSISNYEVRQYVLLALKEAKYQANQENRLTVKQAIEDCTKHSAWLFATKNDLIKQMEQPSELMAAIEEELQIVRKELFTLLSFIYETEAIQQIINNIESNLPEREVLAIEMSDILLEEDIKETVFPLIDRISDIDRVKQLTNYPQQRHNLINRLKDIINYDFSRISVWIKMLGMQTLNRIVKKTPNEVIAHVYNENELLKETAYQCIFNKSEKEYYKHIGNETNQKQVRLNKIVGLVNNDTNAKTIADRVGVLREIESLQDLSTLLLIKLATIFRELSIKRNEKLKSNQILENTICIVIKGSVQLSDNLNHISYNESDFIGLYNEIELTEVEIVGLENTYIFYANADKFFELLQLYESLAEVVYHTYFLNSNKKSQLEKIVPNIA